MYNLWFTSDLHLGHYNVIKYSKRPFIDIEEMHETLINNWNFCVKPRDMIYLLGDFSFLSSDNTKEILARLNGQIYFILGNHDKKKRIDSCIDRFIWMKDYFELKYEKQKMILSHYPFLTWHGSHRGTWNLHGHCHNSLDKSLNKYAKRFDVGVDANNYFPVSFEEIKKVLDQRVFIPVDHHGRE